MTSCSRRVWCGLKEILLYNSSAERFERFCVDKTKAGSARRSISSSSSNAECGRILFGKVVRRVQREAAPTTGTFLSPMGAPLLRLHGASLTKGHHAAVSGPGVGDGSLSLLTILRGEFTACCSFRATLTRTQPHPSKVLFVPSSLRLSRMRRAVSRLLCELLVAIHGLHAYDYTCRLPSREPMGTCRIRELLCVVFLLEFLLQNTMLLLITINCVHHRSKVVLFIVRSSIVSEKRE